MDIHIMQATFWGTLFLAYSKVVIYIFLNKPSCSP